MSRIRLLVAVVAVVLTAPLSPAEPVDTSEADAFLEGVIDPYIQGGERTRFFKAAGKDNELSAKEFAATHGKKGAFAREFDTYKALLVFDTDKSGTIDWFEADLYRQNLRRRVIAAYDTDQDGKLTGKERIAAWEALKAGKVPGGEEGGKIREAKIPNWPDEQELTKEFDADGDGKLSQEEKAKAIETVRQRRRKLLLEIYDADNDGTLSQEEVRKLWGDRRERMLAVRDRWSLRLFDDDMNGLLDEDEKATRDEYGQKLRGTMDRLRKAVFDKNGDGEVTMEEMREGFQDFRQVQQRIQQRMNAQMDTDADGEISNLEKAEWEERSRVAVMDYVTTMSDKYDKDKDGRFNAEERKVFLKAIGGEVDHWIAKHDRDRDGHLTPREAEALVYDFLEEIKLLRPEEPDDDKSSS